MVASVSACVACVYARIARNALVVRCVALRCVRCVCCVWMETGFEYGDHPRLSLSLCVCVRVWCKTLNWTLVSLESNVSLNRLTEPASLFNSTCKTQAQQVNVDRREAAQLTSRVVLTRWSGERLNAFAVVRRHALSAVSALRAAHGCHSDHTQT